MFLSAKNREGNQLRLTADSKDCNEREKFEAIYGEKNFIGLKCLINRKYLGSDKNVPLAFDQNQFISFQVNKIFDKSHFPRVSNHLFFLCSDYFFLSIRTTDLAPDKRTKYFTNYTEPLYYIVLVLCTSIYSQRKVHHH